MNNTKAVIAVLVHVALIVFVVLAIWPALKSGDTDRYHTKTAGVVIQPVVEEIDVPAMTETIDIVTEEVEMPVDVEVVTEQVEVVEAAMEEVVEPVASADKPVMGGGQVHIVTAQGLKYEPLVTVIAIGDTVAWENMSSHDTQAIEGLVPGGSERWHSSMGENFQRTFTQEGIYIYKCTPHWGAAMGGVIIVGNPVNLEAIKAATAKGAAKRLVKKAIKAAEEMPEAEDSGATAEVMEVVTEQVEVAEAVVDEVATEAVAVEAAVAEEVVVEEVVVEEVVVEEVVVEEVVVEEVVAEEVVAEVAAVATPATGGGQVHIVTAQGLKYEPLVTVIALGDTVAWENMSSHDTQAIEGLVPEGSERWHSSMGENYQRTFTQEGIYIFKCTPHWGAAMGGVIIVGNPVNLEAIKAATVKGAAKRLVKKAIKAAEAM
ncbi:hypothetical protein A9Q79_01725 [Methylophaga sp. 42_25_T18]|nr:hypothetical protein A9Q79_01725 [Methylophaga sp. 42_25_T18]